MALQPRELARAAVTPVGSFFDTALRTGAALFRRPFQWNELVSQLTFLVGVTLVPTILLTIPFCAITVFLINQLLIQLGATDLAGAGAGLAVVREIGPLCSVLVVAGAGATAMCADLGARRIREEIDAMEVLGIDPIHRLVVPRVVAGTVVAVALTAVVCVVGLASGYFFSVVVQGASPGQYVANLTLLTTGTDFLISEFKAALFGMAAALVACHRGLIAGGGPKGLGEAVNQTVVYAFVLLFVLNALISAVYLQFR
ncbi:MlaE family ABC transporter permease [Spongisporangium articulatum]|uniref:MlaE family ABC transporter permease n=1 Tax=Spongisporangium articulatum TaxID=3362603 RepID=A0ABW8ATJ2_9ACTN